MTPSRILPDSTGNILRDAIDTQYDLGWNNFIKGQVAKQWSQAQAEYCRSLPRLKFFDSHRWTTTLIKTIWTTLVDVWNARNKHLHTDMKNTTQSVLDKQVKK
eukprot:10335847-Ditylum_brightwellii.AAC.1